MARLSFRVLVGLLWAALAAACLGGQTGQPGSVSCGSTQLSTTAAWQSTTVQAAAQAFEGTYTAGLQWQVEPRSSTARTPVELEDSLQLIIAYEGGQASQDCADRLTVPVSVSLTTSASGITDSGEATLTIMRFPQGLVAGLFYEGALVSLNAKLPGTAVGGMLVGGFDALDPNLPGASASFNEGP